MALSDYTNPNNFLYQTTGQYQDQQVNQATQDAIQNWFDLQSSQSGGNGGNGGGGIWDTVGDIWSGAEPMVNEVMSFFQAQGQMNNGGQPQTQQPVLQLGGQGGGISTNQLITWGAVIGIGVLLFKEMG